MTFQKGVKFRIYPNREQRNLIDRTLGCSRLIYNKGLAMREDAFKSGEKCGYKQTSAMLTALKQDINYAFLKEVDSIALQQALRNLDTPDTQTSLSIELHIQNLRVRKALNNHIARSILVTVYAFLISVFAYRKSVG